jgi:hypothetical protein
MDTVLEIAVVILSVIPCAIAQKRRCKSLVLIDVPSLFLSSWKIIG